MSLRSLQDDGRQVKDYLREHHLEIKKDKQNPQIMDLQGDISTILEILGTIVQNVHVRTVKRIPTPRILISILY